jgi:hypothetical protein
VAVRPEITFARAVRMIARWWWLVLGCGLIVMAAAYLLVRSSSGVYYEGSTRLHVVNTVVSYNPRGEPIAATVVPRTTNEVNPADFRVPRVAETAAARANVGVGPRRLLARLTVVALSPTDVELGYASPSEPEAARALEAYAADFLEWKRSQQERGLTTALTSLEETLKSVRKTLRALRAEETGGPSSPTVAAYEARRLEVEGGIDGLKLALRLIPEQVTLIGGVEVANRRASLPAWLAGVGGLAAGLVAGVLVVLLITRFDPRVRRSSDLQLPGIHVVDGGLNRRPEAMQRLRSGLELAGLGRHAHVLIVTSPTRAENRNGIALALAQTFAATDVPTAVVISADVASHGEEAVAPSAHEEGVAAFLEGTVTSLPLVELGANLAWIPSGWASEADSVLFTADRVERLLDETRRIGRVVILDGPPLEDPSGLLVAASGDLTLLVVQRGKTRWTQLAHALELMESAVRRPVQIFFDRGVRRRQRQEQEELTEFGSRDLSTATSIQA